MEFYSYKNLFCYNDDGSVNLEASVEAFDERIQKQREAFENELQKKSLEVSSYLPEIKEAVSKAFDELEEKYPGRRGYYFLAISMKAVEKMPGFSGAWEGDYEYCGKVQSLIDTYISTCSDIVVEGGTCIFRKKKAV